MRKLTALVAALALTLSAPAASLAAHGQPHGPKPPCHKSADGQVKAKGKPQNAPNKGRKCGFVA
jgi:Spy/CpxP family protein refolding chaperone